MRAIFAKAGRRPSHVTIAKIQKMFSRQTPVKNWDVQKDAQIRALPPGKRISRDGNVYYEYRQNMSDVVPKERL